MSERTDRRHATEHVVIEAEDRHIRCAAEPGGSAHDRLEDWPDIGWRAGDRAEDLGCCGLLLERLAQLVIPRLQLLEQPHVLD
ncbi:MAG TPA: hypothetical protein VGT00_18990, partial [Methylomirabilota bacterium]|nr:hypothetical protein [Methylomirabilota bacterium]